MLAAYINETGPPEVIQYGEVPDPVAAADQVLIRVKAVAINPVDTYIRAGANYWELPEPFIIGCDFAGVIERVGEGVRRFQPGDRVWGTNQGLQGRQGTFAEYCVVDSQWVYPIPDVVEFDTVAASALVGVTAHLGLFREARIEPDQKLFVQGGSGGVGSMVIQMAKIAGAKVMASAGSDEKAAVCRELGADAVANYNSTDLAAEIAAFAPEGVNVFWETQREPDFDFIVPTMAERGRIVLMAGRDARPSFPVGPFYVKECSLHGFVMFKATANEMLQSAEDMNRWFEQGKLVPRIDQVFPLSEAAKGHQMQYQSTVEQSGAVSGKIVLHP